MAAVVGGDLAELAAQKEKEWRDLQNLRTHSLEAALQEKKKELFEEKAKFHKLKEDFKYNLRLLSERDAELERYDSIFAELKSTSVEKTSEISELKIKIEELQNAAAREMKSKEELQMNYQQRIREKQKEMEQYRCSKDAEINKERQDLENFKRNLERQVKEMDDELDIQRQELTAGFEDSMRKREHEMRKEADEMSSQVLAHELKVKLLTKEIEILKENHSKTEEEYQQAEGSQRKTEKLLKQKEWELNDTKAMKDAEIKDLKVKVEKGEKELEKMKEDYKRKHAELDRIMREKESSLSRIKQSHEDKEHEMEVRIRELESQIETAGIKLRQIEWEKQDTQREKEAAIERLEEELADVRQRWENQLSDISRGNVARDLEVEALRNNETKLKGEIHQRKEDVERYKRELNLSVEREAALERAKAQLDLDWQRRYEEITNQQYHTSEDLVKNLTKARDETEAALKEKSRELSQREDLIEILTQDRDRSLATLRQHGLVPDQHIDVSSLNDVPKSTADQISNLQRQNANLRDVIKQMRTEMEKLGTSLPQKTNQYPATEDYVKSLESELEIWKKECRKLREKTQTDVNQEEEHTKIRIDAAGDNVLVRSHMESLNNAIGTLRSEKVEMSGQLRKYQARMQQYETMIDKLSKQLREKQVKIEQADYESGALKRRLTAEVESLRQRITELELQLVEARKEADEYYKANIERNLETTALGQQLSTLKMEIAKTRPPVNFGAQELMIQQLQDEIHHLHQLQKGVDKMREEQGQSSYPSQPTTTSPTVVQLQNKLKAAAKQIIQLAKEKQQLIEVGNRLRAELKKNGLQPPPQPRPPPLQTPPVEPKPSELSEKIQNKLSQLEKLQYELMRQQLASSEATSPKRQVVPIRQQVPPIKLESSSTESEEDHRPPPILKKIQEPPLTKKLSPVPEDLPVPQKSQPLASVSDWLPTQPSTLMSDYSTYPGKGDHLLTSLSSMGGESLQDVWRMLDEESHFSPTPRPHYLRSSLEEGMLSHSYDRALMEADFEQRPTTADSGKSWTVKGRAAPVEEKSKPTHTHTRTENKKTTKNNKKNKIRNYNIRDEH